MTDDRIDWHLWNWARWHRQAGERVGYSSRASGFSRTGLRDFDAMVATVDSDCAGAVEAVLDGVSVSERCAVHHFHLDAVYRFPRIPLADTYNAARAAIGRGLDRRGIG